MSKLFFRLFFVFVISAACIGLAYAAAVQPPFGFGGPPGGGPNAPDQEIVKDFDSDGDGRLNDDERKKARASLKTSGGQRGARRGPPRGGPGGGRGGQRPEGKPGPRVETSDVQSYPDAGLYDTKVLRTLFLEFSNEDWEQELADFKPTDVEVPAKLTVDGEVYPEVGVSFRGASSFFMVPEGSKRSLNISMDYSDDDQRLYGYKTLNLLNCNGDPSMMSTYLYSKIAGQKIATPKSNFVNVVINGRSWGVYANVQQFNKDFSEENFDTKKGARWKVSGNPRGDAGLRYLGDDDEPYRERFQIKSKDKKESWADLIELCRVLNETPTDKLEAAISPILDIEGVLWFLAVDVATINSDGYWTRASDYNIYQSPDGVFHILPHDMNEAFQAQHGGPGGPGGPRGRGPGFWASFDGFGGRPPGPPPSEEMGRGMRGQRGPGEMRGPGGGRDAQPGQQRGPNRRGGASEGGYELDPLVGLEEDRFPLRSKLLAVPTFRELYLQNIRYIASELIAWNNLGPQVNEARELIADSVQADTRKLMTNEAFLSATSNSSPSQPGSLKEFSEKRSAYLLNHPEIRKLVE